MVVFIWLHVVAMFVGFTALIGHDLVLLLASKVQGKASARALVNATTWIGNLGKGLIVAGILLGLHIGRIFGLGANWLVWSYVLTALSIVLGAAAFEPLKKRLLNDAIDAGSNRFPLFVLIVNPMCWVAILWFMIAKPL